MVKIVLMGNRSLAIEASQFFIGQKEVQLLLVANPSDKGFSEGKALSLIEFAKRNGLEFLQPSDLKDEKVVEKLKHFSPDLILSCSYEKVIPKKIRNIPKFGAFNFHYSMLPLNRGCLPVVYGIANGDPVGVTLHEIDAGIDTGRIFEQMQLSLDVSDTAETVNLKCCELALKILDNFFRVILSGQKIELKNQSEDDATYHRQVFPNDRWIDQSWSGEKVVRFINALTFFPHPSARLKLGSFELEVRGPAYLCAQRVRPENIFWVERGKVYINIGNNQTIEVQSIYCI